MAGDWIKMRSNLWDDPRVAGLADRLDCGEAAVIGALYWLWAMADQHTSDGQMIQMTLGTVDRKTGVTGFAAALVEIGWLEETTDGLAIPRFDEHNGRSAKKRAQDAKRQVKNRDVAKTSLPSVTKSGQVRELEKEKEKEKESNTPNPTTVNVDSLDFPPTLPRARVAGAMVEWVEHRREAKKPCTQRSLQMILSKYAPRGPDRLIAAIQHSISCGYQGVYEENDNGNNRTGNRNQGSSAFY